MKTKSLKLIDNRKIFKEEISNYSKMNSLIQKWIDILAPFSNNYNARLSGIELARISKISQPTVSRCLSSMAKINLLDYILEGTNKLYYLDLDKPSSKILLNIVENYKSLKFMQLNNNASLAVNELLGVCETILIFGSYSSGKFEKNSDLDIILFNVADKTKIKKIKERYNLTINEHYSTYIEFEKSLNSRNALALEILNNHVILGNVSKILNIFWRRAYERR